jgi:hypothetical protein
MPSHCDSNCGYSNETRYIKVTDKDYLRIKNALKMMRREKREEKARQEAESLRYAKKQLEELKIELKDLRKKSRSLEEEI